MAHKKQLSKQLGALAAVELIRFLGYRDAQFSNQVIYSSEAFALFHVGPTPATVRQIHWIHLLAAKLGKQPLVLSLTGFSQGAVDLAEKTSVATFSIKDPEPVAGGDSLGRTLLRNAWCRARGGALPPVWGRRPDRGQAGGGGTQGAVVGLLPLQ